MEPREQQTARRQHKPLGGERALHVAQVVKEQRAARVRLRLRRHRAEQFGRVIPTARLRIASHRAHKGHVVHGPVPQRPKHLRRRRVGGRAARFQSGRRAELAGVRLARVLAQLLQEGHLFLHRLGCDFANRIATCEYAKYELYIMRIESDTLVPFGELVGVPYQSRIPNLKEARLAQKRPLPLGAPAG